jgi:hypothetical protein
VLSIGVAVFTSLRESSLSAEQPAVGAPASSATRTSDDGKVKISALDLKAVDPAELITQAGAAVRRLDSNCELAYAYIGTVQGGTIDTTDHRSLMRWTCRTIDPTKPPGQDVNHNQWDVRVSGGAFSLSKSSGGASQSKPPWREPSCPFSRVWAATVASGVPSNAVVSVYYQGHENRHDRQLTMSWSLSVDGHPELTRRVDGETCQVLK